MTKSLSLLIVFFLISVSNLLFSNNPEKALSKFITNDYLKNASIGVYIKNLDDNKDIIRHNSELSIIPASVLKIFTTATALEVLGADKQFFTKLAYDGNISSDSTLDGNIYIMGYGDPALGSNFFEDHYNYSSGLFAMWTDSLRQAGINKINGSIIGVSAKFEKAAINDKWLWEDIGNYFGATPSGLNYSNNEYYITFRTGNYKGAATEIIKTDPEVLNLKFENRVTSSTVLRDRAYIYHAEGSNDRIIKGTLPWKRSEFSIRGSLPNPEYIIAESFKKELISMGINVKGESMSLTNSTGLPDLNFFSTTFSPPLQEIANIINQRSFNLFAESVGQHLEYYGEGSLEDVVKSFWEEKGMSDSGFFMVDASGLSPSNGITPEHAVFLLEYMYKESSLYEVFLNSLAVSGKANTTLSRTFTKPELKGKVFAKSGGMTRVRGYAGYYKDDNLGNIAFCIIANNYSCTGIEIRDIIEDFLVDIVSSLKY